MPVRMFEADQIVTAVGGGTEDDAIARGAQPRDRLHQQRGRKRRAVGIDEAGAFVSTGNQVLYGIGQAVGQPDAARRQQADLLRKEVAECRLAAERRISRIAVDGYALRDREEIRKDVPDEARAEKRRLFRTQRRDETS